MPRPASIVSIVRRMSRTLNASPPMPAHTSAARLLTGLGVIATRPCVEKPQAGSLGRAAFLLAALGLSGLGAQQYRHALPTRVQRQQRRVDWQARGRSRARCAAGARCRRAVRQPIGCGRLVARRLPGWRGRGCARCRRESGRQEGRNRRVPRFKTLDAAASFLMKEGVSTFVVSSAPDAKLPQRSGVESESSSLGWTNSNQTATERPKAKRPVRENWPKCLNSLVGALGLEPRTN